MTPDAYYSWTTKLAQPRAAAGKDIGKMGSLALKRCLIMMLWLNVSAWQPMAAVSSPPCPSLNPNQSRSLNFGCH